MIEDAIFQSPNKLHVEPEDRINVRYGKPEIAKEKGGFNGLSIDWDKPDEGEFSHGAETYVISHPTSGPVKSEGHHTCCGAVISGKKAGSDEMESIFVHAWPAYVLSHRDAFATDMHTAIAQFRKRVEPGTLDVTVFAGKDPLHGAHTSGIAAGERRHLETMREQYAGMMRLFRDVFRSEFSFSPIVVYPNQILEAHVDTYLVPIKGRAPTIFIDDRNVDKQDILGQTYLTTNLEHIQEILARPRA